MSKVDDIIKLMQEVAKENDLELGSVNAHTKILSDTDFDSLALAELVVKLEEETGKDPFVDGFINFQTIEELANLYE
jgi:acyl carrier protein